jgi:hypothetical protein
MKIIILVISWMGYFWDYEWVPIMENITHKKEKPSKSQKISNNPRKQKFPQ